MRRLIPILLRLTPVLLPGLLLTACDILGPTGPEGSGYLEMELISPHDLEGAAVFHLVGGAGLGEVTCEGGQAYYEHHGGTSDIVILMNSPGRVSFRVATENVGKKPDVAVIQVAGADNVLRAATSGYLVSVRRVKIAPGGGQ